jgi:hypothetical protein
MSSATLVVPSPVCRMRSGAKVPARACGLGLGLQQGPDAGQVALAVIAVQQAVRRPAADDGGQLPGQVDRVGHTEIDAYPRGGKLMSRVTGQQDPSVPVPVGLPGLEPVARQPGHLAQRKIRAEHAADAVLELGQRHGRVIARSGGLLFGGLDEQAPCANVPYRRLRQVREVQLQTAERGTRSLLDRTAAGRFNPVEQAPVAQQFHDLPVETAGLRGLPQPRLPLQYQRPHAG